MEAASLAGRSEPGTLIRGRHHLSMESGCGERREIGRLAEVGFRKAEPAERFDPEGHKNPRWGVEAGKAIWKVGLKRIR